MILNLSNTFSEDNDGFDGNIDAYIVSSKEENLKNWFLQNFDFLDNVEVEDFINTIRSHSDDILIIKNLNVDHEFQGQGFGTQIMNEIMSYDFDTAILIADRTESQLKDFDIEKFYNSLSFKSVIYQNNYPIMVFPEKTAENIINDIA